MRQNKVIEDGVTLEYFDIEDTEKVKQRYVDMKRWDNIFIEENGDIILFDELPFN